MTKRAYTRVSTRIVGLLTAPPKQGEPAMLLAAATIVIAVAAVVLRGNSSPAPELHVRHIAVGAVSMQAFRLPPTPRPVPTVRRAPVAAPVRIAAPTSALSRDAGLKAVMATARSLLGRPYSYGAAGPNAFDCSGFTSFVWRAAGLVLPHSSSAQYDSLPRVPVGELQPGDLVFSGPGRVGHAGLYIGDGLMINAPETGRRVEVARLRSNLIGAARPALLLRP